MLLVGWEFLHYLAHLIGDRLIPEQPFFEWICASMFVDHRVAMLVSGRVCVFLFKAVWNDLDKHEDMKMQRHADAENTCLFCVILNLPKI